MKDIIIFIKKWEKSLFFLILINIIGLDCSLLVLVLLLLYYLVGPSEISYKHWNWNSKTVMTLMCIVIVNVSQGVV